MKCSIQPAGFGRHADRARERDATCSSGHQLAYDHVDLSFGRGLRRCERARGLPQDDPAPADPRLDRHPRQPRRRGAELADLPPRRGRPTPPSRPVATTPSPSPTSRAPGSARRCDARRFASSTTPTTRTVSTASAPSSSRRTQAGFVIEDAARPTGARCWAAAATTPSIFGWGSPGAGNAALPQIFRRRRGTTTATATPRSTTSPNESQVTIDAGELADIKVQIDTARVEGLLRSAAVPVARSARTTTDDGREFERLGGQTGNRLGVDAGGLIGRLTSRWAPSARLRRPFVCGRQPARSSAATILSRAVPPSSRWKGPPAWSDSFSGASPSRSWFSSPRRSSCTCWPPLATRSRTSATARRQPRQLIARASPWLDLEPSPPLSSSGSAAPPAASPVRRLRPRFTITDAPVPDILPTAGSPLSSS